MRHGPGTANRYTSASAEQPRICGDYYPELSSIRPPPGSSPHLRGTRKTIARWPSRVRRTHNAPTAMVGAFAVPLPKRRVPS